MSRAEEEAYEAYWEHSTAADSIEQFAAFALYTAEAVLKDS